MNKMKMLAPGVAADGINTSSLTSTQGLPFSQWQRLDAPLSKKSPSEAFIEKRVVFLWIKQMTNPERWIPFFEPLAALRPGVLPETRACQGLHGKYREHPPEEFQGEGAPKNCRFPMGKYVSERIGYWSGPNPLGSL